eukprot:TRINITY_DN9258_c0_g1_i1.p1 TRINITY_DN9258_c0_g1~~TRINITY_DN9258_c0_g1_i1.p1  ORF type:complete len:222 (+),score=46.38 TRINITY_DN9258_c0_g1_i1:40-705(+)
MPVTCYLCGRDFGSRSIVIHVPNCLKKWEDEQKKLPKSKRRPLPKAPEHLDEIMAGKLEGEELKRFNEAAIGEWNRAVLAECEHCGRTFFPHKLAKHQKSCTKGNPMINPNKVKGVASKLESLVTYPNQKRQKVIKKEVNTEIIEDTSACNCFEEETYEDGSVNVILASDTPTLGDFIDVIKENKVLEDNEMSKQLFFLMNYFIRVKTKTRENPEMFPNIS